MPHGDVERLLKLEVETLPFLTFLWLTPDVFMTDGCDRFHRPNRFNRLDGFYWFDWLDRPYFLNPGWLFP